MPFPCDPNAPGGPGRSEFVRAAFGHRERPGGRCLTFLSYSNQKRRHRGAGWSGLAPARAAPARAA